jgi:DNA-binding transcriptional MocR family regulator
VVGIPTDRDGLDTDALEAMLIDGHQPRLLYVIPAYQNPPGRRWPWSAGNG